LIVASPEMKGRDLAGFCSLVQQLRKYFGNGTGRFRRYSGTPLR
jgi:hypothetical protein